MTGDSDRFDAEAHIDEAIAAYERSGDGPQPPSVKPWKKLGDLRPAQRKKLGVTANRKKSSAVKFERTDGTEVTTEELRSLWERTFRVVT